MKILWFPKLQHDIDRLHMTTWIEMGNQLQKMGNEVRIAIAGFNGQHPFFFPVPIIRRKGLRMLSFWVNGYFRFVFHFFSFKPDAVILDVYTFWFGILLRLFIRRRVVFVVDNRTPIYHVTASVSRPIRFLARAYTRLCYLYSKHFCDGLTVITEFYKKQITDDYGIPPRQIGVWGSGVDMDRFRPDTGDRAGMLGIRRDKFVIMQHGEFSRNRGLFESLDAMRLVQQKNILLVLVGQGPAREDLIRYSRSLGILDRVMILPAVSYERIPGIVNCCDCALLPYPRIDYWNANNPLKLLEYLANGKPVICTELWTFRQVMAGQRCAVYIKENTADEIYRAILYCYRHIHSLNEWGRSGIEIVRRSFTWERQANRLIAFIRERALNKNG